MPMPWLRLLTVVVLAAPLTACTSPAEEHDHAEPVTKTAPAAAKPGAETTKSPAKTAEPPAQAAKSAAKPTPPGPGMDPHGHRPPTPPPTASTARRNVDVPQAKTLADTSDVVLNSRVRAALISALSAASQEIVPETKNGVVTLYGTTPTAQQRALAAQVARKARGVRAVKNQLQVKPAKASPR